MSEQRAMWDELPILFGEESEEYSRRYYRFAHIGCPGMHCEDNCAAPWDCAVRGRCRIAYESATGERE